MVSGIVTQWKKHAVFMDNPQASAVPEEGVAVSSGENSFADILSEFEQKHANGRGQAIEGTVVSVSPESVFVDIGRKMDGVIPVEQFRDKNGVLQIQPGDRVTVTITGRDEEGAYQLSTLKVERPRDWSAFQKAFDEKRTIGGTVTEMVKGGFRVDVGLPAFMPASRSGVREMADMDKLVGQQIECRIIKLDTADEDVVVDRRAVLEERERQERQRAFDELAEGAVVRGTVRSLTDFGAFVDIGGVDGLLHVADMAWNRVAKPSDLLSVGDSVEVKILKINPDTRRIALGMKQLAPDPWTLAGERFHVGDRVQGKVSRLADFGAFIELMPGVDGLIHVSELSWSKKIRKPSDVLKPGEMVEALVLGINTADRRISLGLKQALGDPWEEAQKKYTPDTVVEGPVTSLTKFGAFVDLGNGIEGMIHIADISRPGTQTTRLNHANEALKNGQVVKAVVLDLDKERRRVRLGMKQLEPTSVDQYILEHHVGDKVTGRLIDVANGAGKAELGEGVYAICRLAKERAAEESVPEPASKTDLSSMTAMLSAKWKKGSAEGAPKPKEQARTGQVRSFLITKLDPAQKRIEVDLAE